VKNNAPPATHYEQQRINRMKADIGCICCLLRTGVPNYHVEVHHIVQGNKRLGHWWTLPLCRAHHRIRGVGGIFTSIADGSKAFKKIHGTELDLWLKCQHMLELPDDLPTTKILPRRVAASEGHMGVAHAHPARPDGGAKLVAGDLAEDRCAPGDAS
jgi:hypothetical protein